LIKITLEMPQVSKCDVAKCGYNSAHQCHAKAITVGDISSPECDTYLPTSGHTSALTSIAGVGACKVIGCKFNKDYECTGDDIQVGRLGSSIRCLTYQPN
jgi:Domain of Unknown Function (DUF1540)